MPINEDDFWSRLEFRVSREMEGLEVCRARGLWCDGFIPEIYLLKERPPRITGRTWIGRGARSQEPWSFELLLPVTVVDRPSVPWADLLPEDEATRWLRVDFEAKGLTMRAGASNSNAL